MAFGDGFQRNNRSGGSHHRSSYEVFVNTFRGKIAEFVVSDYFISQGREVSQIGFPAFLVRSLKKELPCTWLS